MYEANELFAEFPKPIIEHLNLEGYKINQELLDGKAVRLVTAWNTKESDVNQLLSIIVLSLLVKFMSSIRLIFNES